MNGQCCGIDEAIRYIKDIREIYEVGIEQDEKGQLVINRLEYHRNQAEGVKPKYYKADSALHCDCGRELTWEGV